jgi:Zn-dependent protease with chaperone function
MNGTDGHDERPDPRPPDRRDGHHGPVPLGPPPGVPPRQLPPADSWRPPTGAQQLGGEYGRKKSRQAPLLADLLPALNWFFWSFVVVFWVAGFTGLEDGVWIAVGLWLMSGAAILWRPVEDFLAKVMFRLRQPTMAEAARLAPLWESVAARASIEATAYKLWIQDSDEISAVATTGHSVAVTRWSLYTLPPSHLEAVLAHELAHHLGGRSLLSRLGLWYSLPSRAALAVMRLLLKLIRAVPVLGCLIVGFLLVAYLGVIVAIIMFNESLLTPLLYLTPALAAPILAWLSRWSEQNADETAAELGYGARLIEVFYGWQVRGQESGRPQSGLHSNLLSTHPKVAERIRALEKWTYETRQP